MVKQLTVRFPYFGPTKEALRGRRFSSDEEVIGSSLKSIGNFLLE
jgi:hypothetical protein